MIIGYNEIQEAKEVFHELRMENTGILIFELLFLHI